MRPVVPLLLCSLVFGVGCAGVVIEPRDPSVPTTAQTGDPELYARLVVIGASVSNGFGLPVDMADALDLAIETAHQPPLDLGSSWLFMSPVEIGGELLGQLVEADPTLVIAVDFPFWFGYGQLPESERMARLELGLSMLDQIDAPLLVGGVPDMHFAIGPLLSERFVPELDTIEALDARVRAWADARPRVTFFDLADVAARLAAGTRFDFEGTPWPAEGESLMQADKLHPTRAGLALLTLEVLRDLEVGHPGAPQGVFLRDVAALDQALGARDAGR